MDSSRSRQGSAIEEQNESTDSNPFENYSNNSEEQPEMAVKEMSRSKFQSELRELENLQAQ